MTVKASTSKQSLQLILTEAQIQTEYTEYNRYFRDSRPIQTEKNKARSPKDD